MSNKIGWCDRTWSPITGCSPISEGCANCWAKRFSKRLAGRYGYPADRPFRVTFHKDRLEEPLHWRKPQRVFVISMGDLFHKDVPDTAIAQIFNAMVEPHTYLVLTKRPERMQEWFSHVGQWSGFWTHDGPEWPRKNVYLGVSVENQQRTDERIPILLQIPAAKRFISVEPMLAPVDLTKTLVESSIFADPKLDWCIAGPETGPKARPCNKKWVADLYKQCRAAGVPFWDKTDILGKNIKERPNG